MRVSGRSVLALIAAAGVSGAAAAVILSIHSSKNPVDAATVLAGDLAAVAIAVTLLIALGAWWQKGRPGAAVQVSTPSQAAAAADRLAEEMADRWRQEASRRRIVTPAPVTVRWQWAGDEVTAPRQEVTTPPVDGAGPPSLPELTDPAIFPTVDALREHLIDQVLVTAYPDEKQRARATWWLAWIARRMGTSRDLPWWDIPTWIPRWQLRLIRVLIIAFAVGLVVGITDGFAGGPGQGLLAGLVLGILGGLVFGLGLGRWGEPRTLAPRWPRLGELRRTSASLSTLVIWLSLGLVTCRRQDRVRFLRLLEDASTRQVLRQAGVVYQFRHAALQDRLAAMGTRHDLRTDGQGEKKREQRMAEPA